MKKQSILFFLFSLIIMTAAAACAPAEEPPLEVDLGFELAENIVTEWFQYGEEYADYELLSFQESEPYLVRAALDDGWEEYKCGYINGTGELVIPFIYDDAASFYNGLALATNEEGTFFIDSTGEVVLDVSQYDEVRWQSDDFYNYAGDLLVVTAAGASGVISTGGAEILPCQFEGVHIINDDLFEIKSDETYALYNRDGEALTEFDYIYIGGLSDGRILACRGEEAWGFLDEQGNEAVPFTYRSAGAFSEGLASVQINFLWGFIDVNGQMMIEPQYAYQSHFSEGLAHVQRATDYYYINMDNEIVIPLSKGQYSDFASGVAAVSTFNGSLYTHTLIDQWGGTYLGPKEYRVYYLGESLFMGTFDAYDGTDLIPPSDYLLNSALINEDGERLTPFTTASIGKFQNGLALRTSRSFPMVSGLINKNGAEILPLEFTAIYLNADGACLVFAENFLEDGPKHAIGLLQLPEGAADLPGPDADFPIVYLDGVELFFDPAPVVEDGQILLPVNQLMAKLGTRMVWNTDTMILTCTADDLQLEITPNSTTAVVNGSSVDLSTPVKLVDTSFVGPISIVTEAFGLQMEWDGESREILLYQ